MTQVTRTLIVDDDARFRRRIKELLAPELDIEIVGEAADGRAAILKAQSLKPDLVLMDVRMPRLNGVDATRQLKAEMPELKIIILTVFALEEYRQAALAAGANGYLVKKSLLEALVPAIRSATRAID